MYGTYLRLNVTAFANNITVIRAARRKLARSARRDPAQRDGRKRFYRAMLAHHAKSQQLVITFRL
ncbi:hypothetical protein ACO2I3_19255 [Leptospira interrogans]